MDIQIHKLAELRHMDLYVAMLVKLFKMLQLIKYRQGGFIIPEGSKILLEYSSYITPQGSGNHMVC